MHCRSEFIEIPALIAGAHKCYSTLWHTAFTVRLCAGLCVPFTHMLLLLFWDKLAQSFLHQLELYPSEQHPQACLLPGSSILKLDYPCNCRVPTSPYF